MYWNGLSHIRATKVYKKQGNAVDNSSVSPAQHFLHMPSPEIKSYAHQQL